MFLFLALILSLKPLSLQMKLEMINWETIPGFCIGCSAGGTGAVSEGVKGNKGPAETGT